MPVTPRSAHLFGSRVRDRLLTLLALVPEIHIRGAAVALAAAPSEVAKAIGSLERLGIVASRRSAGARFVSLDPRWFAATELRALLDRLAEADGDVRTYAQREATTPRSPDEAS